MPFRCIALLALGLTVSLAPAQELRVNGSLTSANLVLNPVFNNSVNLTGPAGAPFWWGFDVDPGPTTLIGGIQVPIGVTLNTIDLGMGQPFPAGGSGISFGTGDPALAGITFYSVAAFVDQGALVVSNGITFTFVLPGANAGPDAVALTSSTVTLDGSGNVLPANGELPPGTTAQWAITASPAGGSATLGNDQDAFPTFSADTAGTYTVEVAITDGGGTTTDTVDVHVYDISFASPIDGSFATSAFNVDGTVAGPNILGLEIDGQSVTINAGAFNAGSTSPSGVMNPVVARLTTQTGQVLEKAVTVINATSAPIGSLGAPGTIFRIGGATLDALEPPIEAVIAALPLNAIVTALPPIPIIPTGTITANFTFTGASFDPNTVDFDFFPSNNAIGVSMTLNTLAFTADIDGIVFGGPFLEQATITADSAVVTGEIVIGSNPQGGIEVTMVNSVATMNNFNMSVTGLIGIFLGLLEPAVQTVFETALVGILDTIPAALNPALAGLVVSADLNGVGIPMTVDFPLNGVFYDSEGLTLANDFIAAATSISPTAPALTDYLSVVGTVPGFGPTTPVNMVPFDLASGIGDDVLNQTLAELVRNGILELDVSGTLGTGAGAIVLTAGAIDTILPGAGFDRFPAGAAVSIQVRHTTAPAVMFSSTGTEMAYVHLGNASLTFLVDSFGTNVPVLTVGTTAQSGLAIAVDPVAGTITVTPGTVTVDTTVQGSLAGVDASGSLAGMTQIVQQILPLITGPLSSLPLPAGAFGGGIVEVSVSPMNPDMFITYLDTP